MNTILPLIAIAVAFVSLGLSPSVETKPKTGYFHGLILIIVALAAGFVWKADYANILPAALSFSVGVAVAGKCRFLEGLRAGSGAIAAGIAAALAGIAQWVDPSYVSAVQLALVAGLGLGAWCFAGDEKGKFSLPLATALFGATFVAMDFMGRKALMNEPGAHFGTALGLAVSIAGLVGLLTGRSAKKTDGTLPFMSGILVVLLLLGLGYAVGGRYLENKESWLIFGGAVLAGTVLHWVLLPDGKDDSLAFLMAAVIWIGIATLSFSYAKGFGMSIALAGAVSALLLLGNPRALLSAGPLLGLVFYRVLRESFPEATRALDIGQHYAVIGLAFGMVLTLLPVDWLRPRSVVGGIPALGRVVWAIALAVLPAGLAVVLGAKGMVGFVAGLGFAALIDGLRNGTGALSLVVATALASLTTVSYGWLSNLLDLTRDAKQTAFFWIGGVAIVLVVVIALLSPKAAPSISSEPESI